MRRFADERLARLRSTGDLVIDTYRRAVADHLTGHRLLAYALVRAQRQVEAFDACSPRSISSRS